MTDSARQNLHPTPPAAYQLPRLEDAKRQYVELFGSALVMNTYLKIALLALSIVAVGLISLNVYSARRYAQMNPLVIRIDEVGRAQAVTYESMTCTPGRSAPSHGSVTALRERLTTRFDDMSETESAMISGFSAAS